MFMHTPNVRQETNRATSAFDNAHLWTEIQKSTHMFAKHSSTGQVAADETLGWRLTVDGASYEAQSRTLAGGSSLIVVVVVERHTRELVPDEQMMRAFRFTASEARVARLLVDRRSNREIADKLEVTEHTARRHTEKVLQKLGIRRRAHVERAITDR
jgi:DNA-binding CsgD family transcriptional regulator